MPWTMPLPSHHPLQRPFGCRYQFPDPMAADPDGEGLIALGVIWQLIPIVCLSPRHVPWFNEGEPIAWWSPDPRFVLFILAIFAPVKPWNGVSKCRLDVFLNLAFAESLPPVPIPAPMPKLLHQPLGSARYDWSVYGAPCRASRLQCRDLGWWWADWWSLWAKVRTSIFGESMFHRVTDASKNGFCVNAAVCTFPICLGGLSLPNHICCV